VVDAIEQGWFQREIAEAAYDFQRRVDRGQRIVVGVNAYSDGDDAPPPILSIDPAVEERQLARLHEVKTARSSDAVEDALTQVGKDAADPSVNLMPALLVAVNAYATVGEITDTLERVFGTYTERAGT
jgi:methylmalonyl-CoA mutase N-terminal domain/subunit